MEEAEMAGEQGGERKLGGPVLPGWATPFRLLALALVLGFWGYYIGRHPISPRGGWRYLTNWGLTFNLGVALWALGGTYLPRFRRGNPLLPTALTVSSLVVVLYWTLYGIDPMLVQSSYPLPWYSDLYLHFGTTVVVYLEAFVLNDAPKKPVRPLLPVLGVGLLYIAWVELVVSVSNTKPCGLVKPVCGYPYPFLNDMSLWERAGFYGAGGALVMLLGAGIMVVWGRVQARTA